MKKLTDCKCTLSITVIQSFSDTQKTKREFPTKSTLSSAVFFCLVNSYSAAFDNEELMEYKQKAEHTYTGDYSL